MVHVAGFVLCALVASQPGDRPVFEASDVFELEYATSPAIRPDGSMVVYQRVRGDIMRDRYRPSLWAVDLSASGAPTHRALVEGAGSYSSPVWSPEGDRLLFVAAEEGGVELRVLFMDTLRVGTVARLPEGPGTPAWSPDGETIAFSMFVEASATAPAALPKRPEGASWAPAVRVIEEVIYRNDGSGYARAGAAQVFVVPSEGGTARRVTGGSFDCRGPFAWTPGGDLILSTNDAEDAAYDPMESGLYRLDLGTGGLTRLTDRDGTEGRPTISSDGGTVAFAGALDRGMGHQASVLSLLNLATGETHDLTGELDRSVDGFRFSPEGDALWFSYSDHGVGKLASIGEGGRITERASGLGGTTLGRPYASGAFDVGPRGLFAYTVTDPTRPGDLVVADGSGELFRTRLNEDVLGHKAIPTAERLTATSVGGLEIEGWLVLPPGHGAGDRHPMILEIHGGPFADYGPRFSAEVQLYAAAGYAVLYSNPRGSTSYGSSFANEIHHAYPGRDYDDLMAITDAAIETGAIDPGRLFVTGGSGGGVLTAWIVGKTDRFAAAVVAKPVINWTSFVLTADAYTYFPEYWFGARPWEDPEQYWRRSPLSLVGNVTTPTMLLTGESDYRTPISESEQYYQALRLRRVPTRMVRVPEASHGIASRPSHMAAKVAEVLRWFGEHDPGAAGG